MGNSPSAHFAYGYDLGGSEGAWNFAEIDEYGGIDYDRITWVTQEDEADEDAAYDTSDFAEMLEQRLLREVGGLSPRGADEHYDTWYERQKVAQEKVGVELVRYSYGEYPMYMLVAHHVTVWDDEAKVLDIPTLLASALTGGWAEKLRIAVEALGITPTQPTPRWLLAAYYG